MMDKCEHYFELIGVTKASVGYGDRDITICRKCGQTKEIQRENKTPDGNTFNYIIEENLLTKNNE